MKSKQKVWPENVTHWDKIQIKSAELALSQSEKLIMQSIETARSIRERADKMISLMSPLIAGLIVYILTDLSKIRDFQHTTALCCLFTLITALSVLFRNISPYTIRIPGNNPEDLLNNKMINDEDTTDEQYLQIMLHVCKENKFRNDKNDEMNLRASHRNQLALKIAAIGLVASPFIGFILDVYERRS